MTNNVSKYFKCFGIIILYFCYSALFSLILTLLGIDINYLSTTSLTIMLFISEIILPMILFLIYKKDILKDLKDYKENFKNYFKFGLKWWILGVFIMLSSNIFISLLFNVESSNQVAVESLINTFPLYMIFATVITGPFTEELVFRKNTREIFINDFLYILLSGLFFGFVHLLAGSSLVELIYIIPYGTLGCIFAYIYTKTNNILVSTTFHMIHNFIIVIPLVISIFIGG